MGLNVAMFKQMKNYQKCNHFPDMHLITRKNTLSISVKKIAKFMPHEFEFIPPTWVMPHERYELEDHVAKLPPGTEEYYIVKPEWGCQGWGIYIVNKITDIPLDTNIVVQKYIDKPFLIDGFKFDLWIYVLITWVNPLRVFLYKEGMAWFSTKEYSMENITNNEKEFLIWHLTNYALNKENYLCI